ncbi:nitroreductase family protein [Clostridium tyrobutyricum]|uniref:nitroreductase family protein n=1 Tax=Clostridium tyrobutyricum TaxID=1519 RepID=UPI001C38A3A6|nr:nitroreductase family protein [Clostridium tyrobutyricum]MBV4418540.1 nitroreductase family protein [Clostridium tyrobutyricum]
MSFLELAKKRCSVRKYKNKKVEHEKLLKILEAARISPTAANKQPERLIVVQEQKNLDKIKKSGNLYGAPLVIIVTSDCTQSWKRPYDNKDMSDIDGSIVSTHIILQSVELGLGTIWVEHFDPEILRREFNIPENIIPISIIGIGYADCKLASPNRHDTERKALDEIVVKETF